MLLESLQSHPPLQSYEEVYPLEQRENERKEHILAATNFFSVTNIKLPLKITLRTINHCLFTIVVPQNKLQLYFLRAITQLQSYEKYKDPLEKKKTIVFETFPS